MTELFHQTLASIAVIAIIYAVGSILTIIIDRKKSKQARKAQEEKRIREYNERSLSIEKAKIMYTKERSN